MIAWWRDLSVSKKLFAVVGLMAVLIAAELFTLIFAMNVLSSVRAFVMGEGLWSKAQKDAIHSLYQYALNKDERTFGEFKSHLKIADGDRKARVELFKKDFNYDIVRQGFQEGGNHPRDIDGMIKLLVRFHENEYISTAIAAWTQADGLIDELRAQAEELHKNVRRGNSSAVNNTLNKIAKINSELTEAEITFSSSLGAGSRWLEGMLMFILALTVFTVECTGLILTYRFSRHLGRSLQELGNVASEVGQGRFSVQAPVRSRDELGQLAESLNKMTAALKRNVEDRIVAEDKLKKFNEQLELRVKSRTHEAESREAQLRLITNALPELVLQLDSEERLMFANEAFCSRMGKPIESMLGLPLREAVGDKLYFEHQPHLSIAYTGQAASYEKVSDIQGGKVTYKVTIIPEKNENGHVVRVVLVGVDVSAYKEVEQELKRAKEAADAANATKSAFLANMSHEIRTPLGAILGYSELMMNEKVSASDRVNSVEVIKRNGRLLSNIINDILDLSKIEAGKLEIERRPISVADIVTDLQSLLELEALGKGIHLTVKSEGPIPENIRTDALRLRQILFNIVGNAIKFTAKGSVEVKIKSTLENGDPTLAFIVTDTGKGIDPSQTSQLFEPFNQVDVSTTREFGGTGLGLVLSRKLARALGGDVVLTESRPGKGSTFTITIDPGRDEKILFQSRAAKMVPLPPTPVSNVNFNSFRVLVVDDSADNLDLIARILRIAGAEVDTASTGKEAVDKALANHFGLILMDLQMPVMDGYEATKNLRARGYNGPIVALTAHAMLSERQRCLREGFNDHLSKPIDRQLLLSTVSQYSAS